MSDDKIRIPQSEEAVDELALEADEDEPGVSESQRRSIARLQAELI